MNIYLSARYGRKKEMQRVAMSILWAGHSVTSRWLVKEYGDQEQACLDDIEDVRAADLLVLFTEPVGSLNPGGGRHTELGLALAWSKEIVVCGERETVFCYAPQIIVVADEDGLVELLRKKTGGRRGATKAEAK